MKLNQITWQRVLRNLIISIVIVVLMHLLSSCRKSDYVLLDEAVVVSDLGGGTGTVTWKKGREYLLEGFVFVNDGQTLTIEAGTVIKARKGSGAAASALIVARGGKIIAEGTPEDPIIFTAEDDPMDGSMDPKTTRGLWGGVVILGHAPINTSSFEAHIEGIPISESRALFGGYEPEDNSGVFTYVSIRHAGTRLHDGNELNGLTLGGVGRGTELHHVEVIANEDDGFEFFGGTVNAKNLVAAYCSDDAFDLDMGYQGKLQFLLGIQESGLGGSLIEACGDADENTPQFNTNMQIANATLIGKGLYQKTALLDLKSNIEGLFINSIVLNQQSGVWVHSNESENDAYHLMMNARLNIAHNVFFDIGEKHPMRIVLPDGSGNEEQQAKLNDYFISLQNTVEDPKIEWKEQVNFFPQNPNVNTNLYVPADPFFDQVNFKGAFGTYDWTDSWTLIGQIPAN